MSSQSHDFDMAVEDALRCYRYLTAQQLAVLQNCTSRKVLHALDRLEKRRVAERVARLKWGRGKPRDVWALSGRQRQGDATHDAVSPPRVGFVHHRILQNWVHIQIDQIPHLIPGMATNWLTMDTDATRAWPSRLRPDDAVILHHAPQNKSLLFFIEADMGTEPTRRSTMGSDIHSKLENYRSLFQSEAYRRFETHANGSLAGFRVLFVTYDTKRLNELDDYCRSLPDSDFVWLTDYDHLKRDGAWAKIWRHRSVTSDEEDSIIGSSLADMIASQKLPK